MKVDILAIAAHPDDVELSCCGTLLRHIDQGYSVGLLDLTRGELGTRGSAELRDQEAENARQIMGALFRKNLALPDGFFAHQRETLLRIIEVIRFCQPSVVLANAPRDRHPDHGRASKIISDACYFSGLSKIQTSHTDGSFQEKWRPDAVYHYIQDYFLEPDFVVDITDYLERKFECIKAFKSQFHLPDEAEYKDEEQTPISGADFMEFLRSRGRDFGRPAGFDYAEGFVVDRTLGIRNLFDLA